MAGTKTLATVELCGNGIRIGADDGAKAELHPVWMRERISGQGFVDPVNHQRLFEPAEIDPNLSIIAVHSFSDKSISVGFNDGIDAEVSVEKLKIEIGWQPDSQSPPKQISWNSSLEEIPDVNWATLDDPSILKKFLENFYRYGFGLIRETPIDQGMVNKLAESFGYVRETNFGRLFDVVTKPQATDLAYTSNQLSAHTDNPYREPIPGIQFLHCLENTVKDGLSTLVDGFAIAERLRSGFPEVFDVLVKTRVRFRYESKGAIVQNSGPLIELTPEGEIMRLRLSSRLDFVPNLPNETLDLYYEGRRLLHKFAADPYFEIKYPFEPGMLLMMDNYRTLHGRTSFNAAFGSRHLQGCYTDHDGIDGLYRLLVRDGVAKVGNDF